MKRRMPATLQRAATAVMEETLCQASEHQGEFDEKLQKARQRPLRPNMSALPSEEEIWGAIGKLKSGKAGGGSGILPEMVKADSCEEGFFHLLMDLVPAAWCECRVPKEWSDAVPVPITKKGDLGKCDNWRGISLFNVVRKVIARIFQERVQELAEGVLPESQCGFRKTRGCTDMIFINPQLV